MKISSRAAAVLVAVAMGAAATALYRPSTGDIEIVSASLDPSAFLHARESTDAQAAGQGETAAEAAQYTGDQDLATMPAQWRAIYDHENATRGPEQPIPFNHRFHVTDLRIDCMYCHVGTERSGSGVVPSLAVCMGCHRIAGTGLPPIEELRAHETRGEPVEWEWVYKLPEFVQFSHKAHLRNLECQDCHGLVEEMDRIYQWAPLTMGWCLECHRQPPSESDVATDHTLARDNPPPRAPAPRQPEGFYPRDIDTDYGKTRAPTDCAACHY
ncbi:cytochrome c3 family protein [Candidatus Palauibacter sp.]|uniref:cytochrome c3 family protein n=1 Tax=Candidatus Palauibacter sp. TaxID=3101350 RepID=UPI003B51BF54